MTSKQTLEEWFDRGVSDGATYMIVVCDTFDYDDYPAYVHSDAEAKSKYEQYDDKNMQRVMEVYDLRKDKDEQMSVARVFNLPT